LEHSLEICREFEAAKPPWMGAKLGVALVMRHLGFRPGTDVPSKRRQKMTPKIVPWSLEERSCAGFGAEKEARRSYAGPARCPVLA
jgi:hypothetical protein